MAQVLEERMTRTYSALYERQELEPDTSLVKTYLVEAHTASVGPEDRVRKIAEQVFTSRNIGKQTDPVVVPSEDPGMVTVELSMDREPLLLYVDASDNRFWLIHSMGSSGAVDKVMHRAVKAGPELDRAWMPIEHLEAASYLGPFRGLNLDYDRRAIKDVDFESEGAPVEFLKMQLWGNKAGEVLRILRSESAFPHETTLAKVKVKYALDEEGHLFSLDDVKYDGKVTARGSSFDAHLSLLSHVYRRYRYLLRGVEDRYALAVDSMKNGLLHLDGEPLNVVLARPIQDVEAFCESVFSATEPFRLWGLPARIGDNAFRVHALDLHVGTRLLFEVFDSLIRVYLPKGGCGNTVVRLYTNLQHHYDSLVRLVDGSGADVVRLMAEDHVV